MATTYGCPGTSSGNTRIGVWQLRTKSRVTVYTKSARAPPYMLVRKVSTIAIVISDRPQRRDGRAADPEVRQPTRRDHRGASPFNLSMSRGEESGHSIC